MDAELKYLEPTEDIVARDGGMNADHPMRKVTHQVAFDRGGWTSERAAKVVKLFDEMAQTWKDKDFDSRSMPLLDALKRGGIVPGGVGIELGCGTGAYSSNRSGLLSRADGSRKPCSTRVSLRDLSPEYCP